MISPTPPASTPSCSAWLPSVADTWFSEIRCRLIGSAPSRSWVAKSDAVCSVKLPSISAPPLPPVLTIPSGYWV